MAKTQPTPKKASKKKAAPTKTKKGKSKTLTQELTEKIALKVKKRKPKEVIKATSEIPLAPIIPKSIPEDLRVAVKLKHYPHGGIDFSQFKYRDLQRAAIVRGLSPEDLVNGDIIRLQGWIMANEDKSVDMDLLDKFDEWREIKLEEKHGKGEPYVKLGYIGKVDEEGNAVMVFQPKAKKPKKHIEKDGQMGGLWKGTKKHLTTQCKKDGLNLEKTIAKVVAQFPEAKESSIKIWYKRS